MPRNNNTKGNNARGKIPSRAEKARKNEDYNIMSYVTRILIFPHFLRTDEIVRQARLGNFGEEEQDIQRRRQQDAQEQLQRDDKSRIG